MKKLVQTDEERKAKQKARDQSPERMAKDRARKSTPEYKAKRKLKESTPEFKAKEKERRDRPENKAKRKLKQSTPESKLKSQLRNKKYRMSAKGKKKVQEYEKKRIGTPKRKEYQRDRNAKLKFEVHSHYSKLHSNSNIPCCRCCGESFSLDFLSIDHITGRDNLPKEEKELDSNKLIAFLIKKNFPEGYQVLCHNCNLAKGFKKNKNQCPHETARKEETFAMMEEQSSFEAGF